MCDKSLCEFPLGDEIKINNMDAYRFLEGRGGFPAAWVSPGGFLSLAPSMQGSQRSVWCQRERTPGVQESAQCVSL